MKRAILAILGALILLVVTSCATMVEVRHLRPAEVDLKGRKNLALGPVTTAVRTTRPSPWIDGLQETSFSLSSGWEADLVSRLEQWATTRLHSVVTSSGYFTVMDPALTGAYLTLIRQGGDGCELLLEKGFNMLLVPTIQFFDAAEEVVGRDIREQVTEEIEVGGVKMISTYEKVTSREYYLIQRGTVTLGYDLYDPENGTLITSKSFTDVQQKETKIGTRFYGADSKSYRDERTYLSSQGPSFASLFEEMLRPMIEQIGRQIAPSWESVKVALLDSKPQTVASKEAHSLVKYGNYARAQQLFMAEWQNSRSLAQGYNAAILLEAMGYLDEAVALIDEVYQSTASAKAYSALMRMQEAKALHEKAERQISGDLSDDGQGYVMMQHMVVE
jgi:hypothetical protein